MLITLCYYWSELMKYLFELPDFYIERVTLDYYANVMLELDKIEKITGDWNSQSYYWNSDADTPYHWDITPYVKKCGIPVLDNIISNIPENVHNLVYTVKYSHGNKSYKYISRESTVTWPFPDTAMKFIPPFMSVWGLDEFGNEVKEITKHFKKAAGHRGDFHGQDVKVMDIMKYNYNKIRVKYILSSKDLSEDDSVLDIIN